MGREVLNFNTNWGFYRGDLDHAEARFFDDREFASVTLPHTMQLAKKHCSGEDSVYRGIGWYRRYFTLEKKYEGKKIQIRFEGVMTDSDIYLNGEKIYARNGGYIGFSVDISDRVLFEETNVLAVRVSKLDNPNTPPGKQENSLDFHYWGGIYRNVTMLITEKTHITDALQAEKQAGGGIFVTYPDVSEESAVVNVKTDVVNEDKERHEVYIKQEIKDAEGRTAAQNKSEKKIIDSNDGFQFTQNIRVERPDLWGVDAPHLYTLVTEVFEDGTKKDAVETKIGIRRIHYKSDGFYLNGKRIYLRGANRHQAYQNIGDAAPDSMQYRDALLIKQNGFNAVRAAHYPQSPAFLDACDALGIVVIECQPGWQNFTDTDVFYERTLRDIREMIRRDRNRPSVVLWEASLNETNTSRQWAEDAVKTAHAEYPGDQLFLASDYGYHGELYEVCYKVQDTQWSNARKDWVDFNPDKPFFTREWGDWENISKACRKDGEHALNVQNCIRQKYLNGAGYSDWGGLDASERIGGYFLWSWNDYTRGSNAATLGSGTVDIDRYKKSGYYWLQSMMPSDNLIYGPMVYISSDYTENSSLTIPVFSNCDCVRLYQNGELVQEIYREEAGKAVPHIMKKGGSPIYNFKLSQFMAGTLKAEGIIKDEVVCTHEVRTPGKAWKLEIEVGDCGVEPIADGSDLVPVYLKAVDRRGTIVPDYRGYIHIEVSGAGTLVGENIPEIEVQDQIPEKGIGFIFVKTALEAGDIQIKATAEGLEPGERSFATKTVQTAFVSDGSHHMWSRREADLVQTGTGYGNKEKACKEKIIPDSAISHIEATSPTVAGRETDKLRDGVTEIGTGWLSGSREFPQSVTVYFKKPQTLSGSRIYWEKDSSWYTYDLEITKDEKIWEPVLRDLRVGGQHYKTEVFAEKTSVKAVRVTIKNVEAGGLYQIGMAEWILYGCESFKSSEAYCRQLEI